MDIKPKVGFGRGRVIGRGRATARVDVDQQIGQMSLNSSRVEEPMHFGLSATGFAQASPGSAVSSFSAVPTTSSTFQCNTVSSHCQIQANPQGHQTANALTASSNVTFKATSNVKKWNEQSERDEALERELFSNLINTGIAFSSYDDIPVNVTGLNIPGCVQDFAHLQVHKFVMENIQRCGYSKPTPVQKYAIPIVLNARDLMACAQTGSGKTAAFLIPILHDILSGSEGSLRQPQISPTGVKTFFPACLVLAPTRELSLQIFNDARKLSYRTCLKVCTVYGGRENYNEQVNKVRLGVDILIATPGRLIDLLGKGLIGLDACRFVVLDEGFEPQIRQIIQVSQMPPKERRETMMFSATFPKEIQMLAQDFLRDDYLFLTVGRVGATCDSIQQQILYVPEHEKLMKLVEVLGPAKNQQDKCLVFVETKRNAADLAVQLHRAGYKVAPIHGDLKQFDRERHLKWFREGVAHILVATAVAARGLDIPHVKQVINYELPGNIDEYVHRIGRTGRVGNTGLATSFFNEGNMNIMKELIHSLAERNQDVPDWLMKMANVEREGFTGTKSAASGKRGAFGGADCRNPMFAAPRSSKE